MPRSLLYGTESNASGASGFQFSGHAYVEGKASGKLLSSNLELSFWGGVDPQTGEVIDRHHTLNGKFLQDTILAIPGGRGFCSGSGVLLELLLNNKGPAAMVFQRRENILTLGVMISEEIFGRAIPVVTFEVADFHQVLNYEGCEVHMKEEKLRIINIWVILNNRLSITRAIISPLSLTICHSPNLKKISSMAFTGRRSARLCVSSCGWQLSLQLRNSWTSAEPTSTLVCIPGRHALLSLIDYVTWE